ncbi:D-erythrulose reductase [Orchesella cincta]|uniref:D-erythrulose reductase n=1 Tax=Orchesella cincta TaxID=48709 RepID=A0A1D2MGE5_ORCCI|nr:D-erythrulose reductase [Orchesella cincta]
MELSDFLGISPEHVERQFSVNLKAVVFLSQIIVKKMIAAGNGGSIFEYVFDPWSETCEILWNLQLPKPLLTC